VLRAEHRAQARLACAAAEDRAEPQHEHEADRALLMRQREQAQRQRIDHGRRHQACHPHAQHIAIAAHARRGGAKRPLSVGHLRPPCAELSASTPKRN
jgi:hypothetical protein